MSFIIRLNFYDFMEADFYQYSTSPNWHNLRKEKISGNENWFTNE